MIIILLPLLAYSLNTKVECNLDPTTKACDHLTIYFYPQYPIRINSIIQFILPFTIQGDEQLLLTSMDESTVPLITLTGTTSFSITSILPENIWYKCNLTLITVTSDDQKGIGQFQMLIVASTQKNGIILESSSQIPLSYSVINSIYTAVTTTPIAPVIPATPGTACKTSDWAYPLSMNTMRQLQSVSFSLSAATTNDRLDVILTLNGLNSGFIIHRECYVSGAGLTRGTTECNLLQNSLVLTFQLRSDNPILLTESTDYNIEFFVSHQGDTITANTFTTQIFHSTQLIDNCASTQTFTIDETIQQQAPIQNVEIYLDTPNLSIPSFFGVTFLPRVILWDSQIRIQLAFLKPDQLKCTVFQLEETTLMPSLSFSHYSYDNANLYFYANPNKPDMAQYLYSVNCTGLVIQSTTNQIFQIVYEDNYHTVIQKFQIRQPPRLPSIISTASSSLTVVQSISMVEKRFNSPLLSSITTFQITPTYGIYRVLIEYPPSYTTNVLKCLLNNTITYCKQDKLNQNRIIVYLTKYHNSDLITGQFNITIYGMVNPIQLPYNSRICIMLDDDDILEPLNFDNDKFLNGITQYSYIDDYIDNSFAPLSTSDFRFSTSLARTYDLYLIGNISVPLNSIMENNKLYLRISDQYYIYNLKCYLIKVGDSQANNYVSSCKQTNNYIQISLTSDTSNIRFTQQYQLNISNFRSQDLITTPMYQALQPMIQLFLAKDNSVILYTHQVNGSFNMQTLKIPLFWYNLDSNGQYSRLENKPGFEDIQTCKIYLHHFGTDRLFLGLGDVTSRFNCTLNLILPTIHPDIYVYSQSSKYEKQAFTSQSITQPKYIVSSITDDTHYETIQEQELKINPGDSGYRFNIASSSLINLLIRVQINYTITFPSRDSWNPTYYYNPFTEIPTLYLEIIKKDCSIIPQSSTYNLPIGGYTHPIIIDVSECIPIVDTKLNVTIANNNGLELFPIQMSVSRYRFELTKRTTNKQSEKSYIFQLKTTANSTAGLTTNVYVNGVAIQIITIENYTEAPNATALIGTYSETSNSLQLSMSCTQPSEILLLISTDEISDEVFTKLKTNKITTALNGSQELFKLSPENATMQLESSYILNYPILPTNLITNIYGNRIGNLITYTDYDIAKNVNQSLIQDSSYKTLMNSIRRMMVNRFSLLEKTSQLHLQRIQAKFNYFSSPVTFSLTNLRHESKYSFGYYCKNLNGIASDLATNFLYIANETKLNNLTMGKMLELKFKSKITTDQENNILCALAQYFSLNYYQVLSRECRQCYFQAINYDKINYTEYLTLLTNFVPYENRSTSDQQKFLDNLYSMKIYLNNYPTSNGQTFDITTVIDKKINLTNETMLSIINVTDDFTLTFQYENFKYIDLAPTKRSDEELANQLILLNYEFKTTSMDVNIQASQNILAFVGLHKIEPIFEGVIKHPTGILLRKGILGTFNNISEGVQFAELSKNDNTTLTFKNLVDGQKYILYYSSTDLQNDCLSKQYQETVVQQLTYISEKTSRGQLFFTLILLFLFE